MYAWFWSIKEAELEERKNVAVCCLLVLTFFPGIDTNEVLESERMKCHQLKFNSIKN